MRLFVPALGIVCSLLVGCESMPDEVSPGLPIDAKTRACTHLPSGVVFPKKLGTLERVSVHTGDPMPGAVTAHYDAAGGSRLHSGTLYLYLQIEITVFPADGMSAQTLMEKILAKEAAMPGYRLEPYRGATSFDGTPAQCGHCSFDRPIWNDRSSLKVIVVPHGSYLIRFTFSSFATREQTWQKHVDGFIATVLAVSGSPR